MIIDQTIYETRFHVTIYKTRFHITRKNLSSLYICLSYTDWWTDGLFYLLFRPGFPISKFTPTLHPWLRPLLWVAVDSAIVSAVSSFDCSHGNKLSFYPLMGEQAPSLCDMSVLSFPVLCESLHGTHTATTRGQHQPLWPITSTGWLPWKLSNLRINLALFSRSANVFVSNQLNKHLIIILNVNNTLINHLYK